MGLSKAEWYEKLKSWVPVWYLESPKYQEAEMKALAEILSVAQDDAETVLAETFIDQADNGFLDLHGSERSIYRGDGETDPSYSSRVRVIANPVVLGSIQQLIDNCLNNGSAQIIENPYYGFFGDDLFFSDEETRLLDGTKDYAWFTVITPVQSGGSAATIKAAIITAIEQAKAFGVTYDVLYQT